MKQPDFRSKDWGRQKDKAIAAISNEIDDQLEELASNLLDDYLQSAQFEEDATNYCRDLGWQEPE